jgi:hypothetical protein
MKPRSSIFICPSVIFGNEDTDHKIEGQGKLGTSCNEIVHRNNKKTTKEIEELSDLRNIRTPAMERR